MASDKSGKPAGGGEKLIASNPNRGNFIIHEVVEAGMVLMGTEAKSLRLQSPNIRDAFIDIGRKGGSLEAWLVNMHIAPYSHGNIWNHEPLRRRKLLLHRHQIEKLFGAITQEGMTLIPTRLYFKKGRVKAEVAIAKGKKAHDKRDTLKKKSADREMKQAMKKAQRRG
ncbi:MAG: SsrA-binding protein SmpB [Bacteriovoracia bacterium]